MEMTELILHPKFTTRRKRN